MECRDLFCTPTALSWVKSSRYQRPRRRTKKEGPFIPGSGRFLSTGRSDRNFQVTKVGGEQKKPFEYAVVIGNGLNEATATWIGVTGPTPTGEYRARTVFDLSGYNSDSAVLSFEVQVDDILTDVVFNGVPRGTASNQISDGFFDGFNTFEFVWNNSQEDSKIKAFFNLQAAATFPLLSVLSWDPFSEGPSVKFNDQLTTRSAALSFETTGTIVCATANPTMIALIPGFSQILCWRVDPTGTLLFPDPFPDHTGTPADREHITQIRNTGTSLRLSLLNNEEQNDGYWEATRRQVMLVHPVEQNGHPNNIVPVGYTAVSFPVALQLGLDPDLAIHPTYQAHFTLPDNLDTPSSYQSGYLNDIHNFQFDLNSQKPTHPFRTWGSDVALGYVDDAFDFILIKITGRQIEGEPSLLRFEGITAQEVVYAQTSPKTTTMTPTIVDLGNQTILPRARQNYAPAKPIVA